MPRLSHSSIILKTSLRNPGLCWVPAANLPRSDIRMGQQLADSKIKKHFMAMGFAVRVRSAGQKYGPTCHQRDRADVTEFVTFKVRLSSLGQHVGVLALAGYKRRKSALTANPILEADKWQAAWVDILSAESANNSFQQVNIQCLHHNKVLAVESLTLLVNN